MPGFEDTGNISMNKKKKINFFFFLNTVSLAQAALTMYVTHYVTDGRTSGWPICIS